MNEFDLIEKYFNWQNSNSDILSVGDDCALINTKPNHRLATSVDTLISGVHFTDDTTAKDIAHKALAVNLSDLAAMGATPLFFTLALTLPSVDDKWLDEFSTSLKSLANKYNIKLVGGDTTKGNLSITINVTGTVDNNALLRSGAKVGDYIYVSNTIGDAALAWMQIQGGNTPSISLLKKLNTPEPQIRLGQKLLGVANSCIDISDGLEQDLGHILTKSNVGATIDLNNIPLNAEVVNYLKDTNDWCSVLAGGDDYQLCFTVPGDKVDKIKELESQLDVSLTLIGTITKELGIKRLGGFEKKCQSYQHF